MSEVRNSDGVVLCPDMNDTADWNSGLRVAALINQIEVTNINTDFIYIYSSYKNASASDTNASTFHAP